MKECIDAVGYEINSNGDRNANSREMSFVHNNTSKLNGENWSDQAHPEKLFNWAQKVFFTHYRLIL